MCCFLNLFRLMGLNVVALAVGATNLVPLATEVKVFLTWIAHRPLAHMVLEVEQGYALAGLFKGELQRERVCCLDAHVFGPIIG